jgi:hypothetical protein
MAQDLELTQALNLSARLLADNLRKQVPVKTGKLKRSIKVKANYTGKSVQFRYDYERYGIWVDKGTRPYGVYGKGKNGPWNPNPGKGTGGIRPRFWTSIETTVLVNVKRMMAKVIGQYIRIQFRKKPV